MGKTQLQDRFTSGDCSGTLNDFDIQALLASAPDTSFIDDATFDTCARVVLFSFHFADAYACPLSRACLGKRWEVFVYARVRFSTAFAGCA